MNTLPILQYCTLAVFLTCTLFSLFPIGPMGQSSREEIILEVALYSSISPSVQHLYDCFHYSWESHNIRYVFNITMIDKSEVNGRGRALTTDNYDVVIIGASGRQYFHALQETWQKGMMRFLEDGGGYLGICGGANIASQGMEIPDSLLGYIINQGLLRIANVYINDDQNQEWQYLWKDTGEDHIPVPLTLERTAHPLFWGYPPDMFYLTYGGGPGMYKANNPDPRLGELIPLANFRFEPSTIAPLHYFKWSQEGWEIQSPISTDIMGQYAVISTIYNKSCRIILFSPHPEIPPMFDGHIEEYLGFSIYGIPRFVYRWTGGNQTANDYNWWMIRRAAAWTAHLPLEHLPPVPTNT
jgi:hypothetical protein